MSQAVKDYFNADEFGKQAVLKDLCSAWMDWLTDGLSVILANKLENNSERIYNILMNYDRRIFKWHNSVKYANK